ncbi:MAG: hypothetical protein A2Z72_01750 [Omnitrophica bacterium RBG_13_46_9]|nr:MAG: hypothetical protein A2Z72_01750 [Omnitrophica bacterium RBG_13_46_9]
MANRILCVFVIILSVFSFNFSCFAAQENLDNLKAQLNDLRLEMAKVTNDYKQGLAQVQKECQDNINIIKKEFHEKRADYIADEESREKELQAAYNKKIQPMKQEEKRITNMIEPLEPSNFAKKR